MIYCLILSIAVVLLDQISKIIVVNTMELGEVIPVIKNVFNFTYIENRGAAFGMLSDQRWIFMIVSVIAIVAIFLMAMVTGCMHGVNLMLISIVPKRFKKYGNISTISGLVNACTYIGAAISTYAIALLSERIGWRNTVGVWFVIAIVGTASCIVALKPWNKFIEK